MKKQHFVSFNNVLLRTPLLSLESKKNISEISARDWFGEAIFLSSPEFYAEQKRKRHDASLSQSLYKYFSRSFSRCTPFGLFAGCSVVVVGDNTDVVLDSLDNYQRYTRLDMNYICALIQFIEKMPNIRSKLKYFANDSLYNFATKNRYVEYYYNGVKRIHNIVSFETNEYIEKIIEIASTGATINELVHSIVDDEILTENAIEFIEELINSQILKSELEAHVTGEDSLDHLIKQLEGIGENYILSILIDIRKLLKKIDSSKLGESLPIYGQIIELIGRIGVVYDVKYLFQTDMFKPVVKARIARDLIDQCNDLFIFFAQTMPKHQNENLERFKEAFLSRYEDAEVSLALALDNESGIGYPSTEDNDSDISILVDDLILPNKSRPKEHIHFNHVSDVLMTKYLDAIKYGRNSIVIDETDFKLVNDIDLSDLPDSLAVMCNIIQDKDCDDYRVIIKNIGGSSAANLIGRFCHINPEIENLARAITASEQEQNKDTILAEIVHLSESRIGNIAMRPKLRDYEIKYLASSCVDSNRQINISDIMISIRNNRIVLRSRKLDKEISPRLTNAHNFAFNAMPVYHFLCDMQLQNKKEGLWLHWGAIFDKFAYLPRIEYKRFILSMQKWRISSKEIDGFDKLSDQDLLVSIRKLREKYKIVQQVTINEGDNELYIDLENILSLRTMLCCAKKSPKLYLSEFVLDNFISPIKDINGNQYNNEFIIPFYKTTF